MKFIRSLFIIIGSAVLVVACRESPSLITIEDEKNCRPLYVKTGQDIVVSLKGNQSTGYRWIMVNQPHFLSLIEEKNEAKTTKPGKPEETVWRYKVHSKGAGNLRFTYQRPWESDQRANKHFNCKIVNK